MKLTEISEKHITSIFRVEEQANEEPSMKKVALLAYYCFLVWLKASSLKMEATCSSETSVDI
jgi:hypothetical protein